MTQAWQTARLVRAKKFPDIKKVLAREPSARRPQSVDQQWAILMAMVRASEELRKS